MNISWSSVTVCFLRDLVHMDSCLLTNERLLNLKLFLWLDSRFDNNWCQLTLILLARGVHCFSTPCDPVFPSCLLFTVEAFLLMLQVFILLFTVLFFCLFHLMNRFQWPYTNGVRVNGDSDPCELNLQMFNMCLCVYRLQQELMTLMVSSSF